MNSYLNDSNETLLQEIKHLSALDDPKAISLIYDQYFHRLCAFAFSFTKSKEAAEEVVGDIIIKFWKNKAGIQAIRNLRVYLFTAVRNQSLTYLESKPTPTITTLSSSDFSTHSSALSPLEHLILSEMTQQLQLAVASLPERCQLIFRLVREEGLKYKEVAEILQISVNTIDAQMAIAVRRISASLHIKKPALS
ncbi:MAG: RNA polymerase sigma-70 factor [Bacteroidota bacterium]